MPALWTYSDEQNGSCIDAADYKLLGLGGCLGEVRDAHKRATVGLELKERDLELVGGRHHCIEN